MKRKRLSLRQAPRWAWVFLAIVLLVRIAFPFAALHLVNWALANKLENYVGHVHALELRLYRGAYQLRGFEIRKRGSSLPPLLAADRIRLSLSWKRLLHGEISANVEIDHAALRLIDSRSSSGTQFGSEEKLANWKGARDVVIPTKIESLRFLDSEVTFTNYDLRRPLSAHLRNVRFEADDLRNRSNLTDPQSRFHGSALLEDHAQVFAYGFVDILSHPMRGSLAFELEEFDVSTVNRLLLAYVPVDVYRGRLSLYSEVSTSGGKGKGYVKLFLENAKVLSPKEKFVSVKHVFIELTAAFVNWLLKNSKTGNLASYVPFTWHGQTFDPKRSEAFWSAIENKFSRLPKGLDHSLRSLPDGTPLPDARGGHGAKPLRNY